MKIARSLVKLMEAFERLPGIGSKTAARLTFYLLHMPQDKLDEFASALSNLKKQTVLCSVCLNVSEADPCPVCGDLSRDHGMICVVEQPLDVLAFEKSGAYKGVYHVLHGVISPLNNIGPGEIHIAELIARVKESNPESKAPVVEIILALNTNMEGEATAMYIGLEIKKLEGVLHDLPRVTRLAMGLPMGADIEYADEVTLGKAIDGRLDY